MRGLTTQERAALSDCVDSCQPCDCATKSDDRRIAILDELEQRGLLNWLCISGDDCEYLAAVRTDRGRLALRVCDETMPMESA